MGKLQTTKNDNFKQQISGGKCHNHFRDTIVNNTRDTEFPPESLEDGYLDYTISENELYEGSYVLKRNKVCGYDSTSNDMILGLLEVKPELTIKPLMIYF